MALTFRQAARHRWMKFLGWEIFCEHGVPARWAFRYCSAVYQGGICPVCGQLNRGKCLGLVGMYVVRNNKVELAPGCTTPEEIMSRGWLIKRSP